MKYLQLSPNLFLIRLDSGEEITSSLLGFFKDKKIKSAFITGIGSVEDPKLAHYNVNVKKYKEKQLKGIFEIASLTGNLARDNASPMLHLHTVISDEKMNAFAGHLVSGRVSATCELKVERIKVQLEKKYDQKTGLKLLSLK